MVVKILAIRDHLELHRNYIAFPIGIHSTTKGQEFSKLLALFVLLTLFYDDFPIHPVRQREHVGRNSVAQVSLSEFL